MTVQSRPSTTPVPLNAVGTYAGALGLLVPVYTRIKQPPSQLYTSSSEHLDLLPSKCRTTRPVQHNTPALHSQRCHCIVSAAVSRHVSGLCRLPGAPHPAQTRTLVSCPVVDNRPERLPRHCGGRCPCCGGTSCRHARGGCRARGCCTRGPGALPCTCSCCCCCRGYFPLCVCCRTTTTHRVCRQHSTTQHETHA